MPTFATSETYTGINNRKMIKPISRILAIIALAAATLSCSKALLGGNDNPLDGDLKLAVSGVASDVASNTPLSGIKITFTAYPASNPHSVLPLVTKTVYTDSKGVYSVEVEGFSENVSCTLTAESTNQNQVKYEALTNKIHVTWSGSSFDQKKKIFVVNDCNFQMKKK